MDQLNNNEHIAVEFHCHTNYSRDSGNRIDHLIKQARKIGIDRLAITDHNTISGAIKAKEMAPELIIVGEEVRTQSGELIAYFVEEEVPRGLPFRETLRRFKEQGAFVSIPHPFDWYRNGWAADELVELAGELDAVEVFNARCRQKSFNEKAFHYAQEHGLPMLAGSDAHTMHELGAGLTYLPTFDDAESLRGSVREALNNGASIPAIEHYMASIN